MTKRMLIDASHPEETRIAVINNFKLEEFDFESAHKLPLKGNIYLAKVIRVEPSLQAAFVDYGGGRHGFLAFNEIHPDYFRIPISDREKLEELERSAQSAFPDDEKEDLSILGKKSASLKKSSTKKTSSKESIDFLKVIDTTDETQSNEETFISSPSQSHETEDLDIDSARPMQSPRIFHKKYKIQEVIKSRQILLIQVVKEERGTKGAALTTYISLAGRYCVLMPNALKGGGISRKITDVQSRKRLRSLLEDLELPPTMGVIVRTAGMERTKLEIKRDLDYLLKLWNDIRELTLKSSAPALIYREGDLIKRTLRDFYSKDIEEVVVEGEEAHKNAKDFMRLLMPSHVKRIRSYKDDTAPLFRHYKVEEQIDEMYSSVVQLKSGGYIVINPTEALTAIDVNSGKANRERHIDETALRTNLEAAEETARQIRLRDLAGLIVIDFIDMSDPRHNAAVERRLRDSMREDRARTQLGRISPFGLLELSRQRLRPNLLEASSIPCAHCRGTGMVRSTESVALQILRTLEEHLKVPSSQNTEITVAPVTIYAQHAVVSYLLNQKRAHLLDLDKRYSLAITILGDDQLLAADFKIVSPFHPSLEDEKSLEAPRKENRKRSEQKPENLAQVLTAEDNLETEGSLLSQQRHSAKKRNRRNKHKARRESNSLQSFDTETPVVLKNKEEIPSLSTNNPSEISSENVSERPHHKARRSFRKTRQGSFKQNSQIDQNFVVISDSQPESKSVEVETPFSAHQDKSSSVEVSSSSEERPFRRKSRYPLNSRNRSFKDRKREDSKPLPPAQEKELLPSSEQQEEKSKPTPSHQAKEHKAPSIPKSSETSEGVRKGWWQRLLD
ncbi:MAG: ribonuclease E/G [Proteobacteria bacterium]|nr:ribonuclease E/G [Pseudomonadota bacterium]